MFSILVKGGIVMVPIVTASIISMALVIERSFFWLRQRRRKRQKSLLDEAISMAEAGDFNGALKALAGSDTPVTRVLRAGILQRDLDPAAAMEAGSISEVKSMQRHLSVLDTIITLAPLLGLLGTVAGMIQSFGILSETGIGNPLAVTGGIAEALIATAAGLTVAITTLIPYNYFLSMAERTLEDIECYSTRLEMVLRPERDAERRGIKAVH